MRWTLFRARSFAAGVCGSAALITALKIEQTTAREREREGEREKERRIHSHAQHNDYTDRATRLI